MRSAVKRGFRQVTCPAGGMSSWRQGKPASSDAEWGSAGYVVGCSQWSSHTMAVEASDVLLGIAETAVGVAGFAGVAAAILLNRTLEREDQFRFLCLFGSSLSVVFLAFTPILAQLAGITGGALWILSSGIFLALTLVALPLALFAQWLAMTKQKMAPTWALLILWAFTLSAPLTQVINLAGLAGKPGPVLFIGGLLAWLGAASVLFIVIVLGRRSDR